MDSTEEDLTASKLVEVLDAILRQLSTDPPGEEDRRLAAITEKLKIARSLFTTIHQDMLVIQHQLS